MITPRFKLEQNYETVTIIIRAPYSNLRELDVSVEDNVFLFVSTPYYLRLHLPGSLVENDFSKSSFDADSGEFTFIYEKMIHGEHFKDLDLITKLMCPKIEITSYDDDRKIEILSGDMGKTLQLDDNDDIASDFGFAMMGKKNFKHVSAEFADVFEIDPREVKLPDRRKMRLQYEQGKFNINHYISDFIEDEEIVEIINQKYPFDLKPDEIKFNDRELDFLKDLKNVNYNLNELQLKYCHCSLIDILFAYCYDQRTTFFESTSESGWTIVKLSSSFCWLDSFKEPNEALVNAFRRSLIYPLYRNFNLSMKVFEDLKKLLDLGEKFVIKCLIEMYDIFLQGDSCRYIINNLFINDYITYIMKWDKNRWNDIVSVVKTIDIKKGDLGLNLMEIEDDVNNKIGNLTQLRIKIDDSDDESSDTEDDSSDSDDSSSSSSSSSSDTSSVSNLTDDLTTINSHVQ